MAPSARLLVALCLVAPAMVWAAPKPPVVALVELRVKSFNLHGQPLDKKVRVAHPKGWAGDKDPDQRSIQLVGPEGEGEILIAAVGHPSELNEYLEGLKTRHPSAAPSPPAAAQIRGINPERGERATRFIITGNEVGEMLMIERGDVIVLFAAVVRPEDWPAIKEQLARCYPTVEVLDAQKPQK